MKKILHVNFDWKESYAITSGVTHLLTVYIGTMPLKQCFRLFPDERGYYDGNLNDEGKIVFTKDLAKAKRLSEQRILKELKI